MSAVMGQNSENLGTHVKKSFRIQKKGKRKRELIKYDYGEEDDDLQFNNQSIKKLSEAGSNIQYIGGNSDKEKLNKAGCSDPENKKHICSLILKNFDNLNLLEMLNEESNSLLQLHLFHMFIYSIIHDQDTFFLKTNSDVFSSRTFMKILSKLLEMNDLNNNFDSTFIPDNGKTMERNMNDRTTEKIVVPSIVLKRLDIVNEI